MFFMKNSEKKNTAKTQKPLEKFSVDKAQWQWDSALENFCEQTQKSNDSLTEEDESVIWEYAAHHIAFFLTWLLRHDYLSEMHYNEYKQDIEAVKAKTMTGMEYLVTNCDMVLCKNDISDEVLVFVDTYYDVNYLSDYSDYMEDRALSTIFLWEDYERFEPILNNIKNTL